MEKANFGQIVSFLFGIANDCLVDTYDVGDYRKIILPMMVIRRFDAVLEPTKEKVLKMKEQLDAAGITDQDEALCSVAGEAFCNSSPYTLSDLKSRTNQQQLKSDFILYLNGFSQNVQDIIKRFEFRNQIDKLSEHDILGLLISKFTDSSVNLSNRPIYDAKGNLVQPALDNHTMGTVFEEVIRKFNEETNITDAGRHFTPRDIVELITDLAFVPVKGKIQSTTYRIYDGACGTGGMLTVAEGRMQEMAKEFGKNVSIHLYGQENSDETYAIARSDMLVKGEGVQANNIFFGSTISNDGFSGETFDFMSQYLVSEEQVKKALQIDSFRNLSKDKIVEFASLIPHMDKDVAIAIINQFPAYVESSRNMIEQYNAMCDKVLQSNDDSRKDAVMAYKTILDDLSILLKQDGITPEQQEKITDKMILVADKIADLHEDNRNFLEGIIKYGTPLIGGALLLGAVILGVNVKGTKLPTINGKK